MFPTLERLVTRVNVLSRSFTIQSHHWRRPVGRQPALFRWKSTMAIREPQSPIVSCTSNVLPATAATNSPGRASCFRIQKPNHFNKVGKLDHLMDGKKITCLVSCCRCIFPNFSSKFRGASTSKKAPVVVEKEDGGYLPILMARTASPGGSSSPPANALLLARSSIHYKEEEDLNIGLVGFIKGFWEGTGWWKWKWRSRRRWTLKLCMRVLALKKQLVWRWGKS